MANAKPALLWLADTLGIDRNELKQKENFDSRLKFQKVSFLLKTLGVSPFDKFEFNMYLHGPYSSGLAAQYYEFNGDEPETVRLTERQSNLLGWFASLNLPDMEVASSILLIQGWDQVRLREEDIFSVLTASKPWVTSEQFGRTIKELRDRNLAY